MQATLCPFCMNPAENEICPHCGRNINHPAKIGHLPVGFTLQWMDTYILGAAIGQGGFGITYIAVNAATMEKVAIKEYFPTHCCTRTEGVTVFPYSEQEDTFAKGKAHFLEEARMLKSLADLDSVVNVRDYFEANNSAYLVMEYLDGPSLKDHVEKNGKLPAQEFLTRLKPLMADMEKMHKRGVVHRDIAPDNIILLPDGRLKLIDFGAARSYVGDKSMTVVVKKGFAPVEQYMRKGSNASTDIYALAATIYYCITGIIPPDSAERQYGEAELIAPTALGVQLSPEQELALEKALEIQPKQRIQSVAELMAEMTRIPNPAGSSPAVKTAPKKKTSWWIPVAAALVLCAGAGVLFMGKGQPAAPAQTEPVQISEPATVPAATTNPDEIRYNEAVDLFLNGEYGKAAIAFHNLGDFRDAKTISRQIWNAITPDKTIGTGCSHTVAVKNDGTVLVAGRNQAVKRNINEWNDIVSVTAGDYHTVGLKNDGTVLATGTNTAGQCDVSEWTDIVDIVAGESYTAGLKSDGTVVLAGSIPNAETIESWDNIVSIAGERIFIAGLKANGSALFSERSDLNQKNVIGLAIMANGNSLTIKDDGSVLSYNGRTYKGDYASVFGGGHVTLAIQHDGTAIIDGTIESDTKILSKEDWKDLNGTDIVSFDASYGHAVILKNDGTASAYGDNKEGECNVKSWKDIRLPKNRDALLTEIQVKHITAEKTPSEISSSLSAEAEAYNEAVQHFKNEEYGKAAIAFGKLGDFRNAREISRQIWDAVAVRNTIAAGDTSAVAIKNDGTVIAADHTQNINLSEWDDIISVSTASNMDAVGLRSDGTVVLDHSDIYNPIDVSDWHNIVSVSISGRHVVGLKADGTVVADGWNQEKDGTHIGQCDVSDWTDIIAVAAGNGFTVALKTDGTVIKTGYDIHNVYEITKWTDVVAVDAGLNHIVALKSDGTVVSTGWDSAGECNVSHWTDIVAIVAGSYHTLGIKSDGTAVGAGHKGEKRYDVADWNGITDVASGWNVLAGLQSDGVVVTAGRNQDIIKNWQDIKQPADRDALLATIELDYIT